PCPGGTRARSLVHAGALRPAPRVTSQHAGREIAGGRAARPPGPASRQRTVHRGAQLRALFRLLRGGAAVGLEERRHASDAAAGERWERPRQGRALRGAQEQVRRLAGAVAAAHVTAVRNAPKRLRVAALPIAAVFDLPAVFGARVEELASGADAVAALGAVEGARLGRFRRGALPVTAAETVVGATERVLEGATHAVPASTAIERTVLVVLSERAHGVSARERDRM